MALDQDKGVWKSAKGKGRRTPKGRQFEDEALNEVKALLENRPRQKDLLIEFLHAHRLPRCSRERRHHHVDVAGRNDFKEQSHR